MGGLINYYHGESGLVTDHKYICNEGQEAQVLSLQGNPHRTFAYDYWGGDVHIDPLLAEGDTAVFIRLEPYGGLWVRERDCLYPQLQQAHDRVLQEIRRTSVSGLVVTRLHGIWGEQYIADETRRQTGNPFSMRPATEASFFLSFSSKNVLLARQIFEDLKYDAKVEVWFDLDQAGESPEHRRRVEKWLREAVHSTQGFILLWTKAAKESRWVRKEMEWASEKASYERDFRFIVLKLDDEPIPTDVLDVRNIIDCHNLWPISGINEELFASIAGRTGRTAWLEQHRRRGITLFEEDGGAGYEPFRSDSGIAVSLRNWEEDGVFCWRLQYEKDGRLHRAFGRGEDQAVDLGIRSGDYVGFVNLHRAPLVRFWPGRPLWMRSEDLSIRPEDVWVTYRQKSGTTNRTKSPPSPRKGSLGSWPAKAASVVDGDTVVLRVAGDVDRANEFQRRVGYVSSQANI